MASESDQPNNKKVLFPEIGDVVDADDEGKPTEIESYCVNCEQNGITRLLLTRIPHWRDIVIMSFECEHCSFHNNEVQFAGIIAEKGCTYTCEISSSEDLDRQLVRSESASVKIHEIDLELPSSTTQRGSLTTVEGLISAIIDDLSSGQPVRRYTDEETYKKIEAILERLKTFHENREKCTVSVNDPAGNSYIENLCAPNPDPKLKVRYYNRTREMNIALGLNVDSCTNDEEDTTKKEHPQNKTINDLQTNKKEELDDDNEIPEIMIFPANCSNCNTPSDTRMHMIDIPHFKEVVIMSTACGYKSNEVKAGGPISLQGKRIKLKMEDIEDMSRDILKSETCSLAIPEIDLELTTGTLGGRFTTVEGLLRQVSDELQGRVPFGSGDSVQEERHKTFAMFIQKLNKVISGELLPVHLILDDPLANSYLQNLYAPDSDPNMQMEYYDRTWEQNEALGLNDMNVENYEANNENDSVGQEKKS
ncbi:9780_t:CDS:2 [Ambispora gerdemannii]|uniref:9780_t:CDS:1 n=1 Tax=Ambispora gerdemannii TaxID=144530 RepID=A0A9N9GUX9_9GLOM|nr:9780_t:CDS:2 [Ambispora gerdemannii]